MRINHSAYILNLRMHYTGTFKNYALHRIYTLQFQPFEKEGGSWVGIASGAQIFFCVLLWLILYISLYFSFLILISVAQVEYRLPQITIGAKEQWQPYLGDLFIIICVRYYAHTHKHKTRARACALNTKTNKIKRVKDVKVKKQRKAR